MLEVQPCPRQREGTTFARTMMVRKQAASEPVSRATVEGRTASRRRIGEADDGEADQADRGGEDDAQAPVLDAVAYGGDNDLPSKREM